MSTAPDTRVMGQNHRAAWEQEDGCEESQSCLICPLPMCRYEDENWYVSWKAWRRAKRNLAFLDAYPTTRLAAKAADVTLRTMARARAIVARGEPGRLQV